MRHIQSGLGLIEVLVSLLILAVAILGFSALQMQTIKSTTESVDRSQALLIMRSMAEKIRANPSAIAEYKTAFNTIYSQSTQSTQSNWQPAKACNDITATTKCTANEIADYEVYNVTKQLSLQGLNMNMDVCPSSGGGGTSASSSTMYSYCLITAWGKTNPTIGTDDNPDDGTPMDCLTPRDASNTANIKTGGTYYPRSTCMFLEVN